MFITVFGISECKSIGSLFMYKMKCTPFKAQLNDVISFNDLHLTPKSTFSRRDQLRIVERIFSHHRHEGISLYVACTANIYDGKIQTESSVSCKIPHSWNVMQEKSNKTFILKGFLQLCYTGCETWVAIILCVSHVQSSLHLHWNLASWLVAVNYSGQMQSSKCTSGTSGILLSW